MSTTKTTRQVRGTGEHCPDMALSEKAALIGDYLRHGWPLIPIPPGLKGPRRTGWNRREACTTDPAQAHRLAAGNVGLALAYAGACTLDVDDYIKASPWLEARGVRLDALLMADDAVQIRSGRENRAKLLYRLPDGVDPLPLQTPEASGLELRCASASGLTVQDVLPPSIHPDTGLPYTWGGAGDWRELPELPPELLTLWRDLARPAPEREPPPGPAPDAFAALLSPAQVRDIRSALGALAPEDYDTWLRVGMALHSTGAGQQVYGLWWEWSSQSAKFNAQEMPGKWASFKADGRGVSLSAIFGMAQDAGWLNPAARAKDGSQDSQEPSRSNGDWPVPQPLPKLPPVPDFNPALLPDALAPWVADAADRARFRPEFAAVASMCALGSVLGRKLGIRLKSCDDWTEFANVWGALIGPPSALKSPAMREAMRPFKALQVTADKAHAEAREAFELETEGFKLRKDAKRKAAAKVLSKNAAAALDLSDLSAAPPDAPVARTYWTSDATAERLGELLAENPDGLLVERDELSSLLVGLEDDRNATARGLYLSGWSGKDGYRFDRIMRGTTTLPKFALSVVGGIQPGPLSRYVRGAFTGERADGLLQRFQLAVWPDSEPFQYIDRFPDDEARRMARALFERVDAFEGASIGSADPHGGNDRPFIRLSAPAQELFSDWLTRFMRERQSAEASGSESPPLAAHFGKYPGLVGKLALILHVADDPQSFAVSERTLLKALAWIQYLTPHARRLYHAVDAPETAAADLLLARIKRGELPEQFKSWEIARKCWHGLGDRESVKRACRLLYEFGWLIELDPGGATGGRPADPTYAVSPAVGKGAA